jgi:type IV secretion system protein TrbL
MEELDVIDRFLATFIAYIDSGFGLLEGDVAYLTTTLIVIDITLAGLFWALSENSDVIAGLIRKVLYVGFFAYVISNFQLLSGILFDSFAALGIKAGSGTLTGDDLMRPGYIAGVGFEAALPLLEEAGDLLGPIAFFHNFVLIAVLMVAWAIILAAFFILAVQLFVAILEFKLTTLAGFILVPFALWNKTAFLAERVLGNVITSGIKLMVLAIIIGIGSTLFSSVTEAFSGGDDITLADVMGAVLAAMVFLWMGVFGPGIASGLVSGAPQLGAGSAAGTAALAGAGLALAGAGGLAGARAASAGVRAGASLAGAARTSYDLGRLRSGSGGWRGAAAGVSGMAAAGAGMARAAFSRPASALAEAWSAGGRAAFAATGGTGPGVPPEPGDRRPAWARKLASGHRLSQAATVTAHTLRDGDRPMSGAAPDLKSSGEP